MLQNVQRGPNVAGDSLSASLAATASGTANTKGAWAQLWASTAVNSSMLVCMFDDVTVSATNTATLVDIGIGGAGSEVVVIANISVGGLGHGTTHVFPLYIPAGTRVSIRLQSAVVSKALAGRVSLVPAVGDQDAAQIVDTYGADTANSKGVTLATPSVAGTKTGWTQIVASTTRDAAWITWSFASNGTNIAAAKGGVDIGYGGAGSEQVLVGNIRWEQLGTEAIRHAGFVVPCNIPAGTRLAVRWDSTSTAAASVINAMLHTAT